LERLTGLDPSQTTKKSLYYTRKTCEIDRDNEARGRDPFFIREREYGTAIMVLGPSKIPRHEVHTEAVSLPLSFLLK